MTEKTVMDALVLMKRTGNLLNDLEDLTRQLAQSIDRNDQVSIQMLIAMREEPLAKLQTADRALREQLEALPDLAEAGALPEGLARTLLAAVGDKALGAVPRDLRDQVRADVLKNVLILQV